MDDINALKTAKRHNKRLLKHVDRIENNIIQRNLKQLELRILFGNKDD